MWRIRSSAVICTTTKTRRLSTRTAQAQTRALTVSGTLSLLAILLAGMMATVALVTLRPIGH